MDPITSILTALVAVLGVLTLILWRGVSGWRRVALVAREALGEERQKRLGMIRRFTEAMKGTEKRLIESEYLLSYFHRRFQDEELTELENEAATDMRKIVDLRIQIARLEREMEALDGNEPD